MKNSLLLSVLTPEDLEYLHQHMEVKSYRKNQTILPLWIDVTILA